MQTLVGLKTDKCSVSQWHKFQTECNTALALFPRQPGSAPAVHDIALIAGVLVALEAFQDVIAITITRLRRHHGGSVGAVSAAAEKETSDSLSTCCSSAAIKLGFGFMPG